LTDQLMPNRSTSQPTSPPQGCFASGRLTRPRVVFGFTITDGKIVAIDLVADQERLSQLDLVILEDQPS
jgi:hypothetical protein